MFEDTWPQDIRLSTTYSFNDSLAQCTEVIGPQGSVIGMVFLSLPTLASGSGSSPHLTQALAIPLGADDDGEEKIKHADRRRTTVNKRSDASFRV